MPIVLARIDDRLIHGQVVEGWLKKIRVTHILVVSDEAARDEMQKTLLGMAAPSNVKVSTLSVDDAVSEIKLNIFDKDFLLILFSNPADALKFLNLGVKLASINVGGMHFSSGKRQILKNLSVDNSDIDAFENISKLGVELEGRILPDDTKIDVMSIIREELSKK
ncbi:MAG: PTS sugar transporter subunit IIB [Elusimicrobia bacterium]|nr:PTS sugar transporter subunit IIB [Elusimicrobiota bacterium]